MSFLHQDEYRNDYQRNSMDRFAWKVLPADNALALIQYEEHVMDDGKIEIDCYKEVQLSLSEQMHPLLEAFTAILDGDTHGKLLPLTKQGRQPVNTGSPLSRKQQLVLIRRADNIWMMLENKAGGLDEFDFMMDLAMLQTVTNDLRHLAATLFPEPLPLPQTTTSLTDIFAQRR